MVKHSKVVLTIFCLAIMVTVTLIPVVNSWAEKDDEPTRRDFIPGPYRHLRELVQDLINATDVFIDADMDGIPDDVERIIGTDPLDPDSDRDKLTDWEEVQFNTNPNAIDSNDDGIPDSTEMIGLDPDIDGDEVSNAWDRDNDGDGVSDSFDLSPFAGTGVRSSFTFDINSSGQPIYLDFQVRPEKPGHMQMMTGSYDWPKDDKAMMKDLDNSTEDLYVNAVLKLKCDTPPSQEDVIDYNIIVDGDTCIIPLNLVREYGRIVALRGKMFLPSYSGKVIVSLSWSVTAFTDEYVSSIKAYNDNYVSSMEGDTVLANYTGINEGQQFHIEELGDGMITIRDMNRRYLGIDEGNKLTAEWSTLEENCKFTMEDFDQFKTFKDHEGRSLIALEDGTLTTSNQRLTGQNLFVVEDAGTRSNMVNLITYDERISLVGFTATENFGTEIGIVYGDDIDQLILSNGYIARQYLRNNSNNMTDITVQLEDIGVTLSSMFDNFQHRDQAIAKSITEMNGAAISSLPEGVPLPIITIMEDSSKLLDLSELPRNGSYTVNLSSEPVKTLRMMKNTWYEAPSTEPLHPGEVIEEIVSWDLEREIATDLASIMCFWCTSDATIISVGDNITQWDIPKFDGEWFTLSNHIYESAKWAIKLVDATGDTLKYAIKIGKNIDILAKAGKSITEGLQSLVKTMKITKIVTTAGDVLKFLDTIAPILDVIGLVIDVGVGIFVLIVTCVNSGWDSFSASVAMARFYIETAYATVMFLIGLIPIIGQIIGIIMLIADLVDIILTWIPGVTGWQELLMGWILNIVAGVHLYCELDMEFITTEFKIDDKTNNGLDAGDRLSYRSLINTTVTKTKWGSDQDLEEGYIEPFYYASVSSRQELANNTGTRYSRHDQTQIVLSEETVGNVKTTEWDVGTWIEPGFGMVNYPYTLVFYTEYTLFYEEYNYIAFWFPELWERKELLDRERTEMETMYFDIMPENIHDLQHWNYITASDPDGDTLNETNPTGTSPWSWDTDGDLLGDKYEIDNGLDPMDRDPDGDGLTDRIEVDLGLDTANNDTDGDGLSDNEEREGWVISFIYEGQEFFWHIASDPALNDTDGDGVSDMFEFLCILNPMSNDTNGDGIKDELIDYITIEVEDNGIIGNTPFSLPDIIDMAIDKKGFLYIISSENGSLIKLRSDGSLVWEVKDENYTHLSSVVVGKDGMIYAGVSSYDGISGKEIKTINPNGTCNRTIFTSDQNIGLFEVDKVAVDEEGYIYGFGMGEDEEPYLIKVAPNGTWMNHQRFDFGEGNYDFHKGTFRHYENNSIAVDSRGRIFILDPWNQRVQIYHASMEYFTTWNVSAYNEPHDIWIDSDDNIYISESDGVNRYGRMFDKYRREMDSWILAENDGPICGEQLNIYMGYNTPSWNGRIARYWQNATLHEVEEDLPDEDTDGDGLSDAFESAGWSINVTMPWMFETYNVSSSIKLVDTDIDGLSDLEEFNLGTDPTSFDTDMDTLPDMEEIVLGTDPTTFDTDMDTLDDGLEMVFGSDPLKNDSDGELLLDNFEFEIGTDPNDNDTDDDGLTDYEEWLMGWDPTSPDQDGDMMFDGEEDQKGTNPKEGDHDGDGIIDGYERIFDTDPANGDSDGDQLPDGWEVDRRLNPVNNDTDGDGMLDNREIEIGYNPLSRDSDGDGIPDNMDYDFTVELDSDIVITSDEEIDRLVENLTLHNAVKTVSPDSLKTNHMASKYIVIIGEPSEENGTAGALITELLADAPDLLEGMISGEGRSVVRYGVWSPTQTIILLTHVVANDHNRILGILKSVQMTIEAGYLMSDYLTPVGFIVLDSIDVTRTVDAAVFVEFDGEGTVSLEITASEWDYDFMNTTGYFPIDQYWIGKMIEIDLESAENMTSAMLRIYYTLDELDRNGDGDTIDDDDFNEDTLVLYRLEDGSWMDLSGSFRVETEDLIVNGVEYAGYISAELIHFSVFAIAGSFNDIGDYALRIGPVTDKDGDPIEGARVLLQIGVDDHRAETDEWGNAYITISREIHDTTVSITIEKDGYETLTYVTNITAEGVLEDSPPPLEKVKEEKGMMMVGILLIIFLAIAMFCILIFFRRVDEEYYPEE